MEKLTLFFPVKPAVIRQRFANDPAYYARFHDRFGNPEKGHMGVDFIAPHGTPVYAACDGMVHYEKDGHGGEGIVVRSGVFDYKGQPATYNIINWHLCGDTDAKYPSPIKLDGNSYPVKCGDLIGHADNTGAPFESSGDHLHFGLCPFDLHGNTIEAANGFNGCIDPQPFFNGQYAEDQNVPALTSLVNSLRSYIINTFHVQPVA
jgi:murein DD-endopeptidase MepM/ murein hydrolase activator NlpD